jgi:hypothetical protein
MDSEPLLNDSMAEYPTMFDPSSLVRKGFCPVHSGSPALETHSLYFEQHGTGEKVSVLLPVRFAKIGPVLRRVLITTRISSTFCSLTGLIPIHLDGTSKCGVFPRCILCWFSITVVADTQGTHLDAIRAFLLQTIEYRLMWNRRTSGMAEDIIVLLDHVGWTSLRQIHVVGASLGGMIAQGESALVDSHTKFTNIPTELAWRIPDRIASLILCVTTPGGMPWQNLPPVSIFFFM